MNAKKWLAIPMMILGALGVLASSLIELSNWETLGLPAAMAAFLSGVVLNPVAWIGIFGLIMWRSAPKQTKRAGTSTHGSVEIGQEPSDSTEPAQSSCEGPTLSASKPDRVPSLYAYKGTPRTTTPDTFETNRNTVRALTSIAVIAVVTAVALGAFVIGTT